MPLNPTLASLLSEYPIISKIPVQWGDMDSARHVNNTVYIRWLETGRIEYFVALALTDFTGELNADGPILGSIQCKYIFPMTYPDTAILGTRIRDIQEDRFVMETAIVSEQHERLAALGSGVVVAYDYKNLKKSTFSPAVLDQIKKIEASR